MLGRLISPLAASRRHPIPKEDHIWLQDASAIGTWRNNEALSYIGQIGLMRCAPTKYAATHAQIVLCMVVYNARALINFLLP